MHRDELRICWWNIYRGALDRDETMPRWPLVLQAAKELAASQRPDMVYVNEAYRWATSGRAEEFAAAIGADTWNLARHETGYDMMIFLRRPLVIDPHTWMPQANWMTQWVTVGLGTVIVPEPGWPNLMAAITHLSPWGGQIRWLQSHPLASLTDDRGPVILAGDFNCIGPHDPEPDMTRLRPSQVLFHKTPDSSVDNPVIDRRALATLADVAWQDVAELYDETHPDGVDGRLAIDTPTSGFWGGPEAFMPCRKGHVLLNPLAAELLAVTDYQVHGWQEGSLHRRISDHVPLTATLTRHPHRGPSAPVVAAPQAST